MRQRSRDEKGSGALVTKVERHHSGAPEDSEMTAFTQNRDQRDSGVNHERAVSMGAMNGASDADADEAAECLEGIQYGALAQGDYRAAECEVETAEKISGELPKIKLPAHQAKALKRQAARRRRKAAKLKKELKAQKRRRRKKARSYADLPWQGKAHLPVTIALVTLALALAAFDVGVIKSVFVYVPMKELDMWVIALALGAVMALVPAALWGPLASQLGDPADGRLLRKGLPSVGSLLLTLVALTAIAGLLYLGYHGLAEFRSDGIRLKARGLALDPLFFLFIQLAGALGLLVLGTWREICAKGKVLLKEIAALDAAIGITEGRVDGIETDAEALELQAATMKDDAKGAASLRILGVGLVGAAKAEASRRQGMSSAMSAPVHFWTYFNAARAKLVSFSSSEEAAVSHRRESWLNAARVLTVVGVGLTTGLLLGPLAGVAAGLVTGAFTAYRAGFAPDAKGSLRRMADESPARVVTVASLAGLAAGASAWALLGPWAGIAALTGVAGVLLYHAFGGAQGTSLSTPDRGQVGSQGRVSSIYPTVPDPAPPAPTPSTNGSGREQAAEASVNGTNDHP